MSDKITSQSSKVNVCTDFHTRCSHEFITFTPFHHQRHPFLQYCSVFGILHTFEKSLFRQGFIASPQELHILLPIYSSHVWHLTDKMLRILDCTRLHYIRPKLC